MLSQRITKAGVKPYLENKYKQTPVLIKEEILANITPLLQNDYGGDLDCSLTSITCIVNFLLRNQKTPQEIYNVVEKVAYNYFYEPTKRGTNPLFITSIMKKVFKHFGIDKNVCSRYFKNIGVTLNTISKSIDNGMPIIFNIDKDGREYYNNHTITIIGYGYYQVGTKTAHVLYVYDNWSTTINMVDWELMGFINSINLVQ